MKWSFSTASVAFVALSIVACGDDTSATGAGGGSTSTAASTGAGSPTSSSASASPTSTGSVSGSSSGEGGSGVASSGQGGSVASSGQGGSGQGGDGQGGHGDGGSGQGGNGQGGSAQGGNGQGGNGQGGNGDGGDLSGVPCFDECANDAGCDQAPPVPGNTCGSCVLAEATTQGECAIEAAFGDGCQSFAPCADYVTCRINGGNDCEVTYPEGAQRAQNEALYYCGRCGEPEGGEGGGSGLACGDECANDAGCDEEPPLPGLTCGTCVQTQANAQTDCALEAALGDACQSDADCTDYVTCVLAQESNCAQTYADGYEIARQEALFTCGGCGDGAD